MFTTKIDNLFEYFGKVNKIFFLKLCYKIFVGCHPLMDPCQKEFCEDCKIYF